MWLCVFSRNSFEDTLVNAQWRKTTQIGPVAAHALWQAILRVFLNHTVEKSHANATKVIMPIFIGGHNSMEIKQIKMISTFIRRRFLSPQLSDTCTFPVPDCLSCECSRFLGKTGSQIFHLFGRLSLSEFCPCFRF